MRRIIRHRRTTAVAGAIAASALVLTGCSDSAGPEEGVTTDDLTRLEDQVSAFDDRLGALEEDVSALGTDNAVAGADTDAGAGEDMMGQEVTISAEVSEIITTTDVGSALRVAGEEGPSVAVLAASPPAGLDVGDVVQITGTVQMIHRDSFQDDFGIGADELFDDPDGFFTEAEGQPAISAEQIEVLQESSD